MPLLKRLGKSAFMEDYTYNLDPDAKYSLGAHMLEVCPSVAAEKPRIEVHPLGIGDREAPARLVFEGHAGPAIVVSLIDIGGRLRLIVQDWARMMDIEFVHITKDTTVESLEEQLFLNDLAWKLK